jgi:hypothetical protein
MVRIGTFGNTLRIITKSSDDRASEHNEQAAEGIQLELATGCHQPEACPTISPISDLEHMDSPTGNIIETPVSEDKGLQSGAASVRPNESQPSTMNSSQSLDDMANLTRCSFWESICALTRGCSCYCDVRTHGLECLDDRTIRYSLPAIHHHIDHAWSVSLFRSAAPASDVNKIQFLIMLSRYIAL